MNLDDQAHRLLTTNDITTMMSTKVSLKLTFK